MRVLLLGIGNPGRGDDGLGPALAALVEQLAIDGVTVDSDYQLTIDDAADAAEHDVLLIADAAAAGPEPFSFTVLASSDHLEFSSHSVEPGGVLGLCTKIFGKQPLGYVLAIRGYDYEHSLSEGLSGKAQANLEQALAFVEPLLRSGRFAEAAVAKGAPD